MKQHALIPSYRWIAFCALGVALAACNNDQVTEYEVEGVVAGVHADRQTLEVVHGDIPGYMPGMQMPFPVASPEMLEGLEIGDQVRFELTVTNGAGRMTGVEKLPPFSDPLPAFTLETLEGGTMSSSELLGKVAVINFWASWCEPCKVEMPFLQGMVEDYPASDFAVVGITQDPENRDAIDEVLSGLGITYPILMTDTVFEGDVGGIPVIPGTLVVNREGQVVYKRLSVIREEAGFRALVEGLL